MGVRAGSVGVTARGRRALGILGGTFDPIHFGHLAMAEEAREALDLDGVVFVPAGLPPHKQDIELSSGDDREAMLRLAVQGNPSFEVSRTELDRPGPSYTVVTMAEFAAQSARERRPEPVFIMSAEALEGLPTWHQPQRILELCLIAVAPRPGAALPDREALGTLFPGLEERFLALPGPRLGHASSDIRARAASGRSIRYLVPGSVARYIAEHHLYLKAGR